jgi:four helix bundle protein
MQSEEHRDSQAIEARDPQDLSERLLGFAVRVGKVVNALPTMRLGRHVAAQLVRSGTSAAPNYEEGCAAESRADFVHKLSISLKELRESRFWIRLIVQSELLPEKKMTELLDECTQLCKIIAQSIVTAKKNRSQEKQ